ncbi:winged helix-turn-helix transcriptional regulator [Kitasatospora sp. NPDC001574]
MTQPPRATPRTTSRTAPRTPATATTQTVAQVNQTVLLEVLRRHGSLSRQRLAAESGLSTATVHRLVEVLRTAGLVIVETERAPSSGGRPPQLVRYNVGAQTVLAVAMRPRRIVGVVADLHGAVLHETEHHWTGLGRRHQLLQGGQRAPGGAAVVGVDVRERQGQPDGQHLHGGAHVLRLAGVVGLAPQVHRGPSHRSHRRAGFVHAVHLALLSWSASWGVGTGRRCRACDAVGGPAGPAGPAGP